MTSPSGARSSGSYVLEDIQDVVTGLLGEFVQESDRSLRSIAKTAVKEVVKGALLGALQGLVEAVGSLFRSARAAVFDYIAGIVHRVQLLLLEALRQLLRRIRERKSGEIASAEFDEDEARFGKDETWLDEDEARYSSEDMEPAGRERMEAS